MNNQQLILKTLSIYCGQHMFGDDVTDPEFIAYNKISKATKAAICNEYYIKIHPGVIVYDYPTIVEYRTRLKQEIKNTLAFYNRFGSIKIVDEWAKITNKYTCFLPPVDFKKPTGKRFSSKKLTIEEYFKDQLKNCFDFLAESYIVSFFNNYIECPECGVQGCIGLSGGTSLEFCSSFKDGVCMNCYNNGVDTVFEIKVRNENGIKNKTTIYAGNFVAIQALLHKNINVYLIIVSRDTGSIRLGKIVSANTRINETFLYSVQENLPYCSPASIVKCSNLVILPMKMTPLCEVFTPDVRFQILDGIQ